MTVDVIMIQAQLQAGTLLPQAPGSGSFAGHLPGQDRQDSIVTSPHMESFRLGLQCTAAPSCSYRAQSHCSSRSLLGMSRHSSQLGSLIPFSNSARICCNAQRRSPATIDASSISSQDPVEPEVLPPLTRPSPTEPSSRWQKVAKAVLSGVGAGVIAVALMLSSASPALAARSGGRMGGSSFSSARSAMPSSSSGSGFSSSFSSSFGGSSLGSGSRMSTSSRHLSISPGIGWFGSPAPYVGGGYAVQSYGGGGGGLGNIIILAVGAAIVYGLVSSFLDNRSDSGSASDTVEDAYSERVTVARLQVGLLGTARSMQRDLEKIADRADTDSPTGLHYVLQGSLLSPFDHTETVLGLLRNPKYCVYGASQMFNERTLDRGEDTFNRISMEERGKYKEETLVNYGGRQRSAPSRSSTNGVQELIVVTILLAAKGNLRVPAITNSVELKDALNKLGAVRSDQVFAVEVLWTPQDDQDSYSKDEMFEDFPTLNTL